MSAPTTIRKLHWNKSVTANVCLVWSLLLENITLKWKRDSWSLVRKLSRKCFERKQSWKPKENSSQPLEKKNKLNLILRNLEFLIIYWTCHHLFWFCFLKLLLIFYCQSSFELGRGFPKSNCKIKVRIFSNFILIFNLRNSKIIK